MKREKSWLLEEADRLRSQKMLASLGAGSSSSMCVCELISGLRGGALPRPLCACSHFDATGLGTHSELNPEPLKLTKDERRFVPCMGEYLNLQSSNLLSLSLSLFLSAKSLTAGAEAADRIPHQELAALAILTCVWKGCNERATIRCPWCHQVPYCSLEHRNLNFERHGVECRARAMYR